MFNGKELSRIINVKNDCSSFETAKKYFNLYLFVFLDCFDANSRLCPKSNEINYWYIISCLGLMLYYWAFGRTGSKVERFTQNIQLWRSNLSSQHRSVVIQFGFFEILASYVAIWAFYEKICFPTRISSWISFNYGCQGKIGLYFCSRRVIFTQFGGNLFSWFSWISHKRRIRSRSMAGPKSLQAV